MKQFETGYDDIALKIASPLQVPDLCNLGSCSRFWRELCGSDCIWLPLCRERWPHLDLLGEGWRGFYIQRHTEMAQRASAVVKFVEQRSPSLSLEVGVHLEAIELLRSMQFSFKDVQMFLFKLKHGVLLNLVGLHYCFDCLGVPAEYVMEALQKYQISERQVCVKWWKRGRLFYGFPLRDESLSRRVSLGDLVMPGEEEVLGVLCRGAIHEVRCVQITVA